MKSILFVTFLSLFIFSGCGGGGSTPDSDSSTPTNTNVVNPDFYGAWKYADDNSEVYITSNSTLSISQKDSNLLEVTTSTGAKRFLIRDGLKNVIVSGSVAEVNSPVIRGLRNTRSIANMNVILTNVKDSKIKASVQTDSNGAFSSNTLPSGDYTISGTKDDLSFNTTLTLDKANQDLGNFTLVESQQNNFKTELIMNEHTTYGKFIYGYEGLSYSGKVRIKNISNVQATGLSYVFDTNNSLIKSFVKTNVLGTLEANQYIDIPFTVSFKQLQNLQEDIKVKITIKDVSNTVWYDFITFKVYKRPIQLNFKTIQSGVNGFIVLSNYQVVQVNNFTSKTLYLPYLPSNPYYLYLSNATLSGETAYSIGHDIATQDITNFTDTGIYEPNNTEATSHMIGINSAISGYLHKGDLDIYKLDMSDSNEPSSFIDLHYHSMSQLFDKYDGRYTNGNDDGVLNKGEKAAFRIAIENKGSSTVNNVVVSLSTTDEYITLTQGNAQYRTNTIAGNSIEDTNGYLSTNSSYFLKKTVYSPDDPSSNDFAIEANTTTPDGHVATINVTMTDEYGNSWTDSFTVTIQN